MKFWMWNQLKLQVHHGWDLQCAMIMWSSEQKQQYVLLQTPFCAWGSCQTLQKKIEDGKAERQTFDCPLLTENYWESMENQLSSGVTSLQILQKIQNDLQERNIEREKFEDRILYVNVQRHRLDKKRKRREMYFWFSQGQDVREEILAGTLDVLRPWRRKEAVWKLQLQSWGKLDSIASQMVQWFKERGHPVFASASALSREILRSFSRMETIHFNADSSNTELLFRIIHSVNQLSIFGAVSSWCEEFGRTPYGKEDTADKSASNQNEKILESVSLQEVNSLVQTPRKQPASGNRLREGLQNFEPLSKTFQFTKVCELASFLHRVEAGMSYKAILDVDDGFGAFTRA